MKNSKIALFICWLIMLVMLQACSTSTESKALTKGASEFDNQQYQSAFADLLPVARQGDAEAQYAVGYLYYNGLGVAKDFNSAVSWFNKAADQGNAKAKKALAMMDAAKASEPFPAPAALTAADFGQ